MLKQLKVWQLLALVALTTLNAQTIIVYPNSTSLTVSWLCDWLDDKGSVEHVVYFKVSAVVNDSILVDFGETPHDNTTYRPLTYMRLDSLDDGNAYVFQVQAVDWAGNVSEVHKSVDVEAYNGGWVTVIDGTPPRKVWRLRP